LAQFLSTNQPILLLVGTVEPRKNQVAAVQACRQLWQAGWPGRLLLMGRLGWKCDAIRDELLSLPPDQFHWVRDGSDAELHEAYRRATALVFPSWEEGFGLPIVEALSQGTPVLASDHAVHQEVGQQACEYFPADSPDRLAQLIRHHHADGFRTLRSRATRFVPISWEQSCRELIADVLVAARDRQPDVGRASRNVSPPQRRAG
jgi:alpha-1,2-rhamnosyltransferase